MFTFTQSVVTSKNVSQGTHHVRKSSLKLSRRPPRPTHLIVGARNCVRNWPGFEATNVHMHAYAAQQVRHCARLKLAHAQYKSCVT